MQIDLIKRIRKTLNINPDSKSTLVKKQDLLRYAEKIYQENAKFKDILHPKIEVQTHETERRLEQLNITLLAYETEIKREQQRGVVLESSIHYYKQYLEMKKKDLEENQQKIKHLEQLKLTNWNRRMDLQSFESLLRENMQVEEVGEGQNAMLNLMKQFMQFSKLKNQNQS